MARIVMLLACAAWLAGCTPQSMIASALLPDGTMSMLLSHLQTEEEGNRKQVVALEGKKDWDGLSKLAEKNLAIDARNAGWWFVAGYAHSRAGRHQRAAECFSELAQLAPDDIEAWEMLSQEYLAAGQPQKAVQTLNNALRIRTDSPMTWLLLGRGYEDLTRSDLAAGAYRSAIKLDEGLAQAWLGFGRASLRLNEGADYERAVKTLEKLDPSLAKQLAEMRPTSR